VVSEPSQFSRRAAVNKDEVGRGVFIRVGGSHNRYRNRAPRTVQAVDECLDRGLLDDGDWILC